MFFENIYDTCSCHLAKPLTKNFTDSSPHPVITWEGVWNFYSLQQVNSQNVQILKQTILLQTGSNTVLHTQKKSFMNWGYTVDKIGHHFITSITGTNYFRTGLWCCGSLYYLFAPHLHHFINGNGNDSKVVVKY
jgi:hypothetical protein